MVWEAWYSSTVKWTDVGDEEGDICTLEVVGDEDNKAVLKLELLVVTLTND